jgi:general secretion pathway protein L
MRIGAILSRWIEVLAMLLLAWRESQRERHTLTIAFENQHVVIRRKQSGRGNARAGQEAMFAGLLPRAAAPGGISSTVRNGYVVLELPADKVVTRSITVPAQARKFLSGVIRNQIERLSPWPIGNVVYGFDAAPNERDPAVVDVQILMTSRTDVDAMRQRIAGQGISVDRVVARGSNIEGAEESTSPVTLWSKLAEASQDGLQGVSRLISIGIGATIAASICLSAWALLSADSVRQESDSVAARTRTLQRQVQGGRTPSSAASMPLAERAWFLKESSISNVVLIEALSRALPDSAYLTEVRVESGTLRIVGLANDVPGLLAPLEQSGHMSGVHFFAATTRGADGKSFRFYIEAHVEPHIKMTEE